MSIFDKITEKGVKSKFKLFEKRDRYTDPKTAAEWQHILEFICQDRCLHRFISIALAFNSSDASQAGSLANFKTLCSQKSNGDYCLVTVITIETEGLHIPDSCSPGPRCTCKPAINTLRDRFGCCINLFFDALQTEYDKPTPDSDSIDPAVVKAWLTGPCGITIPPPCVPDRKIVLFLSIHNLQYSYVKDNEDIVFDLLTLDIALAAGVSTSQIKIVNYIQIGKFVQFEIDIQVDTNSFVATTASDLSSANSYTFYNLGTLGEDSKADPLSPFSVDQKHTSTKTESNSSDSSSLIASFFVVLVALLLAF